MRFVLDCSVTMPWLLKNEPTGYAEKILKHLEKGEALVPFLWHLEVGNVLLSAERRKRLLEAESERFLHWLSELPVTVDSQPPAMALSRVVSLGREQNLSSYDAAYLELAMREGTSLATVDKGLIQAAKKVGIPLA